MLKRKCQYRPAAAYHKPSNIRVVFGGHTPVDNKDYNTFQINENTQFYCIKCLAESLPLLNLDNNQFDLNAQGVDYPDEVNTDEIFLSTPQINIIREINKARGFKG